MSALPRSATPLVAVTALVAALALAAPPPAAAASRFLRGASAATIEDVLYPWTQHSDCGACCVCWESALATIFAYWDDYGHRGAGPWENVVPFGGGGPENLTGFRAVTQALFDVSVDLFQLACGDGSGEEVDWIIYARYVAADVGEAYAAGLGYDFSVDYDDWVWWGWDITDEIDADRPVYFGGRPWDASGGGHAVTVVGYDDRDETMFLYDNHHTYLTHRMRDEFADDQRTVNITPGGPTGPCAATEWRCADGGCISAGWQCDTDPDCGDASDERGCTPCAPTDFRCDSGACVSAGRYCDGAAHCPDGSDEQGCGGCGLQQYRCPGGACVDSLASCACTPFCAPGSCGPDGCGGACRCAAGTHCEGTACVSDCPTPCDDGDPCNGVETCQGGCVSGVPLRCDDGDPCNGVETCRTGQGCVAGAPPVCDDGDGCNGLETCQPGRGCVAGAAPDCDDGDPCTSDGCHDGACRSLAVPGCCARDAACDAPWERCDRGGAVCVPVLCAPCADDGDCGPAGNRCVADPAGPRCGVACDPAGAPCREGAVCVEVAGGPAQCRPATGGCECAAHARRACDAGDLYWWSSCGRREELAEGCAGRGCVEGACGAAPAEPAPDAGGPAGPDAGGRDAGGGTGPASDGGGTGPASDGGGTGGATGTDADGGSGGSPAVGADDGGGGGCHAAPRGRSAAPPVGLGLLLLAGALGWGLRRRARS
jgi:hypothetical protein